jgi:hypothetical protein
MVTSDLDIYDVAVRTSTRDSPSGVRIWLLPKNGERLCNLRFTKLMKRTELAKRDLLYSRTPAESMPAGWSECELKRELDDPGIDRRAADNAKCWRGEVDIGIGKLPMISRTTGQSVFQAREPIALTSGLGRPFENFRVFPSCPPWGISLQANVLV